MPWCVGIDEAGYGPNLGPLVQAAVALHLPDDDDHGWATLRPYARPLHDSHDDCLLIDDSKKVYAKGVEALAAGVLGWFGSAWPDAIHFINERPDLDPHETAAAMPLPTHAVVNYVYPRAFNAVVEKAGTKAAVVGEGLVGLLRAMHERLPAGEAMTVHADKQGGRHYYAALVQEAFCDGFVMTEKEGPLESRYRVLEVGRTVLVRFAPRADGATATVAAASMVCKYLRELGMKTFNDYWCERVPGLKPTAGYPGDARRYYDSIREAMAAEEIEEVDVWRVK